ncbi:MAG: 3-hydroxyacyl-CoA dehydrogenase [marine bacterium B5-7]|nr:MAG: 3-hydroxyacyl-CoA dehydrogenase [marine bacterium B5-7]
MKKCFDKVAVLGAGVMGAQIAALLANMNVPVILFELAADEKDRNALSKQALKRLAKLKPAPFATSSVQHAIETANYDDDLDKLKGCDLIIEAIAENMNWKKNLYDRINSFIKDDAILATNTSGLGINKLAEILPKEKREQFVGIHFFNPPRYMHLVELIPCDATKLEHIDSLEEFLVTSLGKGVVVAKDTPNFIANRIGVFNLLATIHHAEKLNIPFEVVDQITAKPLGRPKSGTFRTMDVVGLDVLTHVVQTMEDNLNGDPWHGYYQLPEYIRALIKEGALGQKVGKGIYINKGKQVFSPKEKRHIDANAQVDETLAGILKNKDWHQRFNILKDDDSEQAQFVYRMMIDLFHYCCFHLEDIASSAADIDFAIRWGFGWEQGPFEIMQAIGWPDVVAAIEKHIKTDQAMGKTDLPEWSKSLNEVHNTDGSWSPVQKTYLPLRNNPVYSRQKFRENVVPLKTGLGSTIFENDSVRLWNQDDDIAILSFKTKMHTISEAVLDSVLQACDEADKNHAALVLWHPTAPFAVGADLTQVGNELKAGNVAAVDGIVNKFQQASMALKHCRVPTVAAVQGMALGGGCEFQMHCNLTVAAMESYIGLVEAGVGLLPAGGGLKELVLNAMVNAKGGDLFPHVQAAFELTAMAKLSASALDAKQLGLLSTQDVIVANQHEILHVATHHARALAESGGRPQRQDKPVKVTGKTGKATLMMLATNMLEGHFISKHDYKIAEGIATVLTGGDVESGSMVSQDWLLKLEREYFIELIQTEKTQQRIMHTLKTGKPLRN